MRKILWCKSGISYSSVTNGDLIATFLLNGNFNNSITLSDGVVKAFESNIWIWALYLILPNLFTNLSLSSFKFDEFF